jgi:hypothetical protein
MPFSAICFSISTKRSFETLADVDIKLPLYLQQSETNLKEFQQNKD